MPSAPDDPITELIDAAQSGRRDAWDQVYRLLYDELHAAARQQIGRWNGRGGSPTSLINRTWLRIDRERLTLESRRHLIGVLVRAMRYALLDEARRLKAWKRQPDVALDDVHERLLPADDPQLDRLLALDQALHALSAADPRLGLMVEMRYFGDMGDAEIAQALEISDRTVRRDWRKAQAFLAAQLGGPPSSPPAPGGR